jgi:hypothetical protein
VPSDVVVIRLLEYPPRLEATVDCPVAIPCGDCIPSFSTGLHGLSGHLILSAARTYPLSASTRSPGSRIVKTSNVVEASSWVGTLDPYQVPPYKTYPDLVAEGRLVRVLVICKPVPLLHFSCLWDPEIGPVDGMKNEPWQHTFDCCVFPSHAR